MESTNESFIISTKQTLLETQPPLKHTRFHKRKIISTLLILAILISSTMILFSMYKDRYLKSSNAYASRSTRYYCHLTRYQDLCHDSMSSILNGTNLLDVGPGPIFSGSIRVVINELNNVTIAIRKVLSSETSGSLVELKLSKCQSWAHDSLSRLNESLSMLRGDSDVDSLTFVDYMVKDDVKAAITNASKCYTELQELVMEEGAEEKMRVEEVKLGVEKARKCMVNSIGLLRGSGSILFDFYNL